MTAIGPIFGALSGVGLISSLFKSKTPTPTPTAVPLPVVTPRANSVVADTLSARIGTAENMRTGSGGAESTTGKKTLLGQ